MSQNNNIDEILNILPDQLYSNIYNISLNNIKYLNRFSSFEFQLIFYPYNRKITSNDFKFYPIEEDLNNTDKELKSRYIEISKTGDKLFGIFLSAVIIIIFFHLNKKDLFSLQSIIAVLGAYTLGKDFWRDIEEIIINLTEKSKLSYREKFYYYQLRQSSTISDYNKYAQEKRFEKKVLHPDKIDFIQESSVKTLKAYYEIDNIKKDNVKSAYLISLSIDPQIKSLLDKNGYLLGIKLSFNKNFLKFTKSEEYFQAIDNKVTGCLDSENRFIERSTAKRINYSFSNLKWYKEFTILKELNIIKRN